MRTPSPAAPPAPRRCDLYLVRYVDSRGETACRLFRFAPAAERFAAEVLERGGSPAIHVARSVSWQDLGWSW